MSDDFAESAIRYERLSTPSNLIVLYFHAASKACAFPDHFRAIERRRRLLSLAFLRRVVEFTGDRSYAMELIQMHERFADTASPRGNIFLRTDKFRFMKFRNGGNSLEQKQCRVAIASMVAGWERNDLPTDSLFRARRGEAVSRGGGDPGLFEENIEKEQMVLARDILPNPFIPWTLGASRNLSPDAIRLAKVAYYAQTDSGVIDSLSLKVLADALEECGGGNTSICDHLRSDRPHVRGCWALDWVMGY